MTTFSGIPLAALDFYEALESDNSKVFWTEHKHVYEDSVRAPLVALAAELEPEFGPAKLFRPYRDVRFSKDKTPYKTAQGVWFAESSRYLQVSASGLFIGGGRWETTSEQVAGYRRAVDDERHGLALQKALASLRRAGFEISGDQLTRVPSGYAKDHPRADLLRYKTMGGRRDFGAPDWLETPAVREHIVKAWRQLEPLISWLQTHVR